MSCARSRRKPSRSTAPHSHALMGAPAPDLGHAGLLHALDGLVASCCRRRWRRTGVLPPILSIVARPESAGGQELPQEARRAGRGLLVRFHILLHRRPEDLLEPSDESTELDPREAEARYLCQRYVFRDVLARLEFVHPKDHVREPGRHPAHVSVDSIATAPDPDQALREFLRGLDRLG